MSSQAASKVEQIVNFIKNEAKSKGDLIRSKATSEAQQKKSEAVTAKTRAITRENKARAAEFQQKQRIKRSNKVNEARLQILEAKEEIMQQVVAGVHERIARALSDAARRREIYTRLIEEAVDVITEPVVRVLCRECDADLVREIIAAHEGASRLILDDERLAPPPTAELTGCIGGVVVANNDKHIRVNNTFEQRIKLAKQAFMPDLREILFPTPAPAAPPTAEAAPAPAAPAASAVPAGEASVSSEAQPSSSDDIEDF